MANKYTKKCSMSSVIKEMKMTLRFHFTQSEWSSSRKTTTNARKEVRVKRVLIHC
jgi:hypothetical protein